MGKLIVELPDELHTQLKAHAAAGHMTLKVIVTSLLRQYLRQPRGTRPRKATGLCGAWEDRRSPEELVAELRAARRWVVRARA